MCPLIRVRVATDVDLGLAWAVARHLGAAEQRPLPDAIVEADAPGVVRYECGLLFRERDPRPAQNGTLDRLGLACDGASGLAIEPSGNGLGEHDR